MSLTSLLRPHASFWMLVTVRLTKISKALSLDACEDMAPDSDILLD
jgi:hypothetical protein